jgi:hypothetical protein
MLARKEILVNECKGMSENNPLLQEKKIELRKID